MSKPESMFMGTIDSRFDTLQSQINIDASNGKIYIQRRSSNTGSGTYLGQACMNTRQTYFNISSSSDLRYYLPGLALMPTFHACLEDGVTPVDRTNVGIPWNVAGATIANLQLRINGQAQPIEIYSNNNFGIANTIRLLCEMSRTNIDGMSESFALPALGEETEAETATTFSLACQARSLMNLTDVAGFTIKRNYLWYLPLLFSFASVPCYASINLLEIFIDWIHPSEVLFKKAAYPRTPQYICDDIQIMLDQTQMTPLQTGMELKEAMNQKSAQNFMYKYYDVSQQNYTSGGAIINNSVINCEGAILAFPGSVLGNPNKLQFCMNNISSFTMFYQGQSVPQIPCALDVTNRKNNVEAYFMYKKLCKREYTTNYLPAIPYENGYGDELNPKDASIYFLFCSPFNPALTPKLADASELRVITSQVYNADPQICNTNCSVYLIKIRNVVFQVKPDGTAEKMYS